MIRIPFLRSAIALGALAAPLLACGGRVVSIGSNADQLTAVAPATVSGTVGSCPAGYQHPNICCSGGPTESSSCGAYINKPFRPCDAGSTTYPNALSCCSLSDGSCIDAPSGVTSTPPSPPTGVCTSACPPGWWPADGTMPVNSAGQGSSSGSGGGGTNGSNPSVPGTGTGSGPAQGGGSGVACCRSAGNGMTECMAPASTSGSNDVPPSAGCVDPVPSPEPTPVDAGVGDGSTPTEPPPPPDAGCASSDAGTPAPSPPPAGTCTIPCPVGWTSQPGAPDVCCRDDGNGTGECFSQSSGGWGTSSGGSVGQPEPSPAPSGPAGGRSCFGGEATGPDAGAGATCGCESMSGSTKESLSCDDAKRVCTCTSGSTTSTLPYPTSGAICYGPQALDALWAECGFAP